MILFGQCMRKDVFLIPAQAASPKLPPWVSSLLPLHHTLSVTQNVLMYTLKWIELSQLKCIQSN